MSRPPITLLFLLAALAGVASAASDGRGLSLEERVACRRSIEEVYWRHREWPAANRTAKPALADVLPDEALRARVEDDLALSAALDGLWQQPVEAAHLQAELDRMARGSRRPAMLRELFAALGDDPLLLAECLARPALTDRLAHAAFARDSRIHGELRARAEDAVAASSPAGWSSLGAEYREEVLAAAATADRSEPGRGELVAALGGRLLPGARSEVREAHDRFWAVAVLAAAGDQVRVAVVEWPKTPFDAWWRAKGRSQALALGRLPGPLAGELRVPALDLVDVCREDAWRTLGGSAPVVRYAHSAVWTGSEMVIWGGLEAGTGRRLGTGGRYDPATDTWRLMATRGGPVSRSGHSAVWTGSEMVVWGGRDGLTPLASGGRYRPADDEWDGLAGVGAPAPRSGHTAVWTGQEMIVWGGEFGTGAVGGGGRWAADTGVWTAITGGPGARSGHSAVWSGREMIVWGGSSAGAPLATGGRFDPTSGTWTATATAGAPQPRKGHVAVWTGTEMVVWGGSAATDEYLTSGARYRPGADAWTPTTSAGAPSAREAATAVWTGTEMIVYGGRARMTAGAGGRYNPSSDRWRATATNGSPGRLAQHTAVWSGAEMIVWGGQAEDGAAPAAAGGRYRPSLDSWAPVAENAPGARAGHVAVWTGSEMLVWGGGSRTGSAYVPAVDRWNELSSLETPEGHAGHSAVWTGREMVVWGGARSLMGSETLFASGGRYEPMLSVWSPTPMVGAPPPRRGHAAVWTGTEMVIVGGLDALGRPLGDGARLGIEAGTWTPLPTTGAPAASVTPAAAWTGDELLVWGDGEGARHRPGEAAWRPIPAAGAPSPRRGQVAAWTGEELLIWGGSDASDPLADGVRYSPDADGWLPMAGSGAPSRRSGAASAWTGQELVVWGGVDGTGPLGSGARYAPSADAWLALPEESAPAPRSGHTLVWTDGPVVVWGGADANGTPMETGGLVCLEPAAGVPVVEFTWFPAVPVAGQRVRFAARASGYPSTWRWQFGDGGEAAAQSPGHVFPRAGTFEVRLTATGAAGAGSVVHAVAVQAPAGLADLSVAVADAPDPVVAGAELTYDVRIENFGPDTAAGAALTVELPSNVDVVSAQAGGTDCAAGGATLTCALGDLAALVRPTARVVVRPRAAGTISAGFRVTSQLTDLDPSDDAVTVSTLVMAPPPASLHLIPSVAHAPGAGGTQWRTDVAVVNRGGRGARLTLTYAFDGGALVRSAELADGATREWRDVLVSLFGVAESAGTRGSLEVAADVPLLVTSRTYNRTAAGTYGQHYPALTVADTVGAGSLVVIPQLRKTAAFRSNLGIANLGETPCEVAIRLFSPIGAEVGASLAPTVPAHRWLQIDDVVGATRTDEADLVWAALEGRSPGCRFWAYGSVIDRATGDPTTVPGVLATRSGPYVIPAVAHLPGAGGTQWRTDLAVVAPWLASANPISLSYSSTSDQTVARTANLGGRSTAEWVDVLTSLFGLAEDARSRGTVRVESAGPLVLAARTYNRTAAGSYGQHYPALVAGDAIPAGKLGVIPQLRRNAEQRTNLAVVNLGGAECRVTVRLYGPTGAALGAARTLAVPGMRWLQQDDVFAATAAPDADLAYATIEVTTEGGKVWACASVIDNATGDPTTVPVLFER